MKSHAKVAYTRLFEKQLAQAPLKIKEAFKKRRELFEQDPFHPQLHSHSLKGKFLGFGSINITGDWRAIYQEYEEDRKIIIFQLLGTHSQLYR